MNKNQQFLQNLMLATGVTVTGMCIVVAGNAAYDSIINAVDNIYGKIKLKKAQKMLKEVQ